MIVQNVNQIKLHKELSDAGVPCTLLATEEGVEIIFLSDEVNMQMVQQIIDAHDPSPSPQPPTLEEQIAEKDAQILKLKEEQFKMQQATTENAKSQQELIELLMDMGVI